MKKLTMTIAILLGLSMTTFAEGHQGGLFQRGNTPENTETGNRTGSLITPGIPNHGQNGNQDAPLGSGIAILLSLGAAYLVGKKHKAE